MNAIVMSGKSPDGQIHECFACERCRHIWGHRDLADKCCCCHHCGMPPITEDEKRRSGASFSHSSCDRAFYEKRRLERLEKAPKVDTWDGPVYNDGGGGGPNEDYAQDLGELCEHLEDKLAQGEMTPEEWPEWVWTCEVRGLSKIDTTRLYESFWADDMPEDHDWKPKGEKELDEAIEKFLKANEDVVSWYPDKTAVRVPPPSAEALAEYQKTTTAAAMEDEKPAEKVLQNDGSQV